MSEKRLILVVEDERTISNFICRALTANDYKAMSATTGKEALSLFFSHRPDLVLLDLGLPDMDGLDVLKELSGLPQEVPVIIISARDRESEKVKALDMGADDYVTKPFSTQELVARVRSQLRRYFQLGGGALRPEVLTLGTIQMDDREKTVAVDGDPVALTPTEYDILKLLLEHPGQVFSPREIYRKVWKDAPFGSENTVAVHIRHLREKIEIDPAEPRYLKVVWGQGYKLEKGMRT